MFSSLLSIVDSVLTLDEGCSRNDIISGDQIMIDGNLNKDVASRISGTASLACIRGADKSKKFFIIVGKHKLELQGSMDMNPKPLSMVCPSHKTVRITNDQNKYFEIRFNDSVSFSAWLSALGEALAESICSDVLITQDASNRIVCSNMRRCIHTCELLTSPSKVYIRRVNEIYGIRRKLLEVMGTLRSNPCDVNIKDLRSLKELCWKFPELQSDADMKFLIERMPSDRYNTEDLQVILKDILYAESEDAGVVCAQVYHGGSDLGASQDATSAVASAVLVQDTYRSPHSPVSSSLAVAIKGSQSMTAASTATNSDSTRTAAVPVPKKSRIVLNGVEIQSSARSPSSAGKVLSKQIKIKSKFTTPSQQRKEVVRPKSKSKTPPPNINILSEIKYNVTPPPAMELLGSPLLVSEPISSNKMFSPISTAQDKENLPTVHKNVTPAPRSSVFKKATSVVKLTPSASLIPIRSKSPLPVLMVESSSVSALETERTLPEMGKVEVSAPPETSVPEQASKALSGEKEITIDLIPEVLEQRQSHFGSPLKATTKMPFFSPDKSSSFTPDGASLFDDAVVYAVTAQEIKELRPTMRGEKNFGANSPMLMMTNKKKGDTKGETCSSEKKITTTSLKSSLIPPYEVPKSTFMPLSEQVVVCRPSKLPVAAVRVSASPTVELVTNPATGSVLTPCPQEEDVAEYEKEVKFVSVSTPAQPLTLYASPTVASAANTKPQPITQAAEGAPPSVVRESRGKKICLAQSLLSPPKTLRSKHFTPSKEAVGMSATAAPRTPAPPLPSATSLEKTRAKSISEQRESCVESAQSFVASTTEGDVKIIDKHVKQTNNKYFVLKAGIFAIFAIICAFFASKGSLSAAPAISVPIFVVQTASTPVIAPLLQPIESIVELDVSVLTPEPTTTAVSIAPFVVTSEFEMHVRFEGVTSTNPPIPQTLPKQQPRALQRHSNSMLRSHLRKLHHLLTMPVKLMRSLFDKAFQKFERIRRVLAE